jgi:outer membrane protein assembly factor BamB
MTTIGHTDDGTHARERHLPGQPATFDGAIFPQAPADSRRRRGLIRNTTAAIAAFLLVAAGSIVAWRFYAEWRLGQIVLLTDAAPLVVQVLGESSDRSVGEPFDLVSRAVVTLPAGEYRLRANGIGRIGRTFRFTVNRGETEAHTISIDDGRLLGGEQTPVAMSGWRERAAPIPISHVVGALELTPGKWDFIESSARSLIRRDGATGKVQWDAFHPRKPFESGRDLAGWMRDHPYLLSSTHLVYPAPDLDGDGEGDLVSASHYSPALVALSGKDGAMLWSLAGKIDGRGEPRAGAGDVKGEPRQLGFTAGAFAMADVDHDGTQDLCATFVFTESPQGRGGSPDESSTRLGPKNSWRHRSVIVAVSGRSGRCLWTHPVEPAFVETADEYQIEPAVLLPSKRSTLLAFVATTQWLGLDPATGRLQAGPIELGFMPARPVAHADLDGDGEPEILAIERGEQALRAFSIETGREIWAQTVDAAYDSHDGSMRMPGDPPDPGVPLASCPLVVDLDQDGSSEIVVPDSGAMPPLSGYRGLRLLDGRTGATRWRRAMRPECKEDDGVAEIIAAPDLDGDGTRDLAAVSFAEAADSPAGIRAERPEPPRIYVDALSGKDGHPLWWWRIDIPGDSTLRIWTPFWWGRGPDGWPLLAVPLGGSDDQWSAASIDPSEQMPAVHLLEASTGRLRHTITGLARASLADLDGDGLADIWGAVNGELRAFRGEAAEAWRALGMFRAAPSLDDGPENKQKPAVDLDGDGIADVLIEFVQAPCYWSDDPSGSHTALARSGRDGHVIWKTVLEPWESWIKSEGGEYFNLVAFPSSAGDFDGDGTPDVIVTKDDTDYGNMVLTQSATLPLQVLSGRTGARLWSAGRLLQGLRLQGGMSISWAEPRVVAPNGAPDLIVCYRGSFVVPGAATSPAANAADFVRLARVSGRDGRVIWDIAPSDYVTDGQDLSRAPNAFHDFDGDGWLDFALVPQEPHTVGNDARSLVVISLRDGTLIWSRSLHYEGSLPAQFEAGNVGRSGRPGIFAMAQFDEGGRLEPGIRAFNRGDGPADWSSKPLPALAYENSKASFRLANERREPYFVLANFEGRGQQFVCATFTEERLMRRIVVYDPGGEECARLDVRWPYSGELRAADINGDGRDELIAWYDGRLHAMNRDLKELWSWPTQSETIDAIVPGSSGRPCELIIAPGLCLDGSTGRPLWTGQASLVPGSRQFMPSLLDPGNSTRPPLLIGTGLGATVCRVAMPTTSEGSVAAPRGALVLGGLAAGDPRWARPLPWLRWLRGILGPWAVLAAMGLAALNVVLPLLVLRLARGRRRFYTIRALMSLPVAAALPLMVYLTVVPRLPPSTSPFLASDARVFIIGTLAGLPVILCVAWTCAALVRLRLRPIAALAGLLVVTSLAVAVVWLRIDMKSMAEIEHYGGRGWYLVALPGAYLAAVLWLFGLVTHRAFRSLRRQRTSRGSVT